MTSIDVYAERLIKTNTELGHLYREQSEARKTLECTTRQIEQQERVRADLLKKLGEVGGRA